MLASLVVALFWYGGGRLFHMPSSSVEDTLVQKVVAGDPTAADGFVLQVRPKLVGLARLRGFSVEDAEEIAQDTVVAALVQLRAGKFEARSQVTTWLVAILNRRAIDHHRRHRRHHVRSASLDGMSPRDLDHALAVAVPPQDTRTVLIVREVLSRLAPRQRLVLLWNVTYGLSAREMAPMLRLGVKTTEALLTAARHSFRAALIEVRESGGGMRLSK